MRKWILFLIMMTYGGSASYSAIENFMPADVVVGQSDFTSLNSGTTRTKMNTPLNVYSDGKRLIVSDSNNHRVLIWNQIPSKNNTPADLVLGQTDFVTGTANTGGRTAGTMRTPIGLFTDGKILIVSETENHRVLIWNSFPTRNGQPADVIVGQANGTTAVTGVSRTRFLRPQDAFYDGKHLFVVDRDNARVLIFNSLPKSNLPSADVVIGQPDFTSNTSGIASPINMWGPVGVMAVQGKLIVADRANNRYLVYNKIPTRNGTPADLVIGQPDLFTNSANTGGLSQRSLFCSGQIGSDGEKLFLVDRHGNQRILVHNSVPISNFEPADFVLGNPNFTSVTTDVSQRSFGNPHGVAFDGKRVYVVDSTGHRVLIINALKGSDVDLGPQFSQGKAVVGKVFFDWNGNGRQDRVGSTYAHASADPSRDARGDWNGNGRQDGGIS